jgi:hypothetical protein
MALSKADFMMNQYGWKSEFPTNFWGKSLIEKPFQRFRRWYYVTDRGTDIAFFLQERLIISWLTAVWDLCLQHREWVVSAVNEHVRSQGMYLINMCTPMGNTFPLFIVRGMTSLRKNQFGLVCSKTEVCQTTRWTLLKLHFNLAVFIKLGYEMLITVAARTEAWTVFACSNIWIVGSNPTKGMDVCVRLFCDCAR